MRKAVSIPQVGQVFPTTKWGDVTIVEYVSSKQVKVMFSDGNTKVTANKELRLGTVKNDYQPFLYGVGYYGQGKYACKTEGMKSGSTLEYETWRGLLRRCYDKETQDKHQSYIGCSVCEEWHNFQNFAEWYTEQEGYAERWHLDKDLTVLGNKVYSPATCALIPPEVNVLLINAKAVRGNYPVGVYFKKDAGLFAAQVNLGGGSQEFLGNYPTPEKAFAVYKSAKEKHIRHTAEKFKDSLTPTIYNNLMNYTVSITD